MPPDHRSTVELQMLTVRGPQWFAWEGYAIFDDAGRFCEIQAVGRDVAKRKVMEEALTAAKTEAERANLAKSTFLAAASHDLRQPIQSMFLFYEAARAHVHGGKGERAMTMLGRSMDTLKGLLDSLMDVSRLDAGVLKPEIADFEMRSLLESIGAASVPVAAAKGLEFRLENGCGIAVRSDSTLLGRMVRNLVENAIRYTERGFVRLSCHVTDGQACIEVADSGVGIPPEHLTRIFEEFHQVGNSERDREQGLGLGLAIVKRLSLLLAHPVTVWSEPGQGSTFRIEVPCGSATAERSTPTEISSKGDGHGRLAVLVDDDAMVLMGLRTMLEAWGYEVIVAPSADEAVVRVAAAGRTPDLVVTDYRLRERRVGTETILMLRAQAGAALPGIILTGETGPECRRDAEEHGIGIVQKPVTAAALRAALARQVNGA